MKITLNGQQREFSSEQNLRQIIEQFAKQSNRVIAELNGTILKAPTWEQTKLKDGDTIELVSFVGGG